MASFHARLPFFHMGRFKLRSLPAGSSSSWGDGTLPDFAPSHRPCPVCIRAISTISRSTVGHRAAFPHSPASCRNRRPRRSPSRAGCRPLLFYCVHHPPKFRNRHSRSLARKRRQIKVSVLISNLLGPAEPGHAATNLDGQEQASGLRGTKTHHIANQICSWLEGDGGLPCTAL